MRFDSYHPVINIFYFTSVIICTIFFRHPVFVSVSYICAFLYSVKLNGKRAFIFNLCLIPFALAHALWYSYYNHFGVTYISQNFTGNNITLESLVYGCVLGITGMTVVMWFSCLYSVVSTDKIIYIFGRISPKLSLFISIILRAVPRIKFRAGKINIAREGIGRGYCSGKITSRAVNFISQISILITWTIENFTEVSDSMRCRGYGLKKRTSFSIYRFDNRDRIFVIGLCSCMMFVLMAVMFGQVNIIYDPVIIINRPTVMSFMFYTAYVVFCMYPLVLQIVGEAKFRRLTDR